MTQEVRMDTTIKNFFASVVVLLAVITLSACNGGGSNHIVNSTPIMPTSNNPTSMPTPVSTYSISGCLKGTSRGGVVITATPGGEAVVTDTKSGCYVLSGLPGGSYTVTPSDGSGAVFTPVSASVVLSSVDVKNIDFSSSMPTPVSTYSISGCLKGTSRGGVVITATPGGEAVVTDTKSGCYVLSGLPGGSYTVTPSDGSGAVFTPVSASVVLSSVDVKNIDFGSPTKALTTGELVYTCNNALCLKDLVTGVESVGFNTLSIAPDWYPDYISVMHSKGEIAFTGGNIPNIYTTNMSDATPSLTIALYGNTGFTNDCYPYIDSGFDTINAGSFGNLLVVSGYCNVAGHQGDNAIFLTLMDGTGKYIKVIETADTISAQVFAGFDGNKTATVMYADTVPTAPTTVNDYKANIMKVSVHMNATATISPATLFAANVSANSYRILSVSQDYKTVAFVRSISGEPHIIVKPTAGGTEVDLGLGYNPSWAIDGSGLLLFMENGKYYAVHKDGSGEVSVPTPSNLDGGDLQFLP